MVSTAFHDGQDDTEDEVDKGDDNDDDYNDVSLVVSTSNQIPRSLPVPSTRLTKGRTSQD